MPEFKSKNIFKITLGFLTILLIFAIFKSTNYIKNFINDKAIDAISTKIKRKITFSKINYSLTGAEIDNLFISEKDNKSTFLKIKKIQIGFNIFEILIGKKLRIENLYIENAEINLKKQDSWNFKDIIDLLGENKKPISERYIIKKTEIKNSSIFIKTQNLENFLENVNLTIIHNIPGDSFEVSGGLKSYLNFNNEKLFFITDLNVIFNITTKLNKSNIEKLKLLEFSYRKLKAEEINLTGFLDNSEGKFNINMDINSLFGVNEIDELKGIREIYKKVYAKQILLKEPININLKASFADKMLDIIVNSNSFNISSKINFKEAGHTFKFHSGNIYIEYELQNKKSKISSNLSEQLNKNAKDIIISIEKFISDFIIGKI